MADGERNETASVPGARLWVLHEGATGEARKGRMAEASDRSRVPARTGRCPVTDELDEAQAVAAEQMEDVTEERRERDRRALYAMTRDYLQLVAELREDEQWFEVAREDYSARTDRKRARLHDLMLDIEGLAALFLVGDSKHVDLAGLGRIQFRDTAAGLRIADADAFMAALGPDERALLVETRDHLRTTEAKAYASKVLETGEIIPGVERTEATRSSSITSLPERRQ